jgi:hypothetical protein
MIPRISPGVLAWHTAPRGIFAFVSLPWDILVESGSAISDLPLELGLIDSKDRHRAVPVAEHK